MPDYSIKYFNEDDGCTYLWDEDKRKWMKICPVDKLPFVIKKRVLEDKLDAEILLDVEV